MEIEPAEPEQQELGGLGFAGIWRETYRVLLRVIVLPHTKLGVAILSVLLVAHMAGMPILFNRFFFDVQVDGPSLVVYLLIEMVFWGLLLYISFICTAGYVFRVVSLFDSGATERILRDLLPRAALFRSYCTFMIVVPLVMATACPFLTGLTLLVLLQQYEIVVLPLWVLFGACLAGAAYVAVVSHIACVESVVEASLPVGALRKSRALLAGKFWAAAAVFVPLDGCFAALLMCSRVLTLEGRMGLAAAAVMAVALWAVVVLMLVAQPVVYLVCKSHHHEFVVVDKVHLDYIREYQQPAVDGGNGVEMQPMEATPTATSAKLPS